MPAGPRPRREPTDDWDQLRLLVASPEQETYELLRPIVLFGQPTAARARETGVPERTLRRKAARFDAAGMRSLFEPDDPPAPDRRRLPLGIRRAIVELKAEYPPLRPARDRRASAGDRFDRPVSHHTVEQVLASEPLPLHPPRRFPRYHEIADPVAAPQGDRRPLPGGLERQGDRRLPGDARGRRSTRRCARWVAEGWPGLADRPRARTTRPARSTSRRWRRSAGCRPTPSWASSGSTPPWRSWASTFSPRTCGRILALHRALGAPQPAAAVPHEPQPMPFAAAAAAPVLVGRRPLHRRPPARHRQAGLRHLDPGELQPGPPGQRDLAAPGPDRLPHRAAGGGRGARGARGPRQRRRRHLQGQARPGDLRAPSASQKRADRPGPGLAELHRDPLQRHAPHGRLPLRPGHDLGRAAGRPRPLLPRLQPPAARRPPASGPKGRRSPAAVLGWVQGAWCDPADLDRLFRLRATRVLNAQRLRPLPPLAALRGARPGRRAGRGLGAGTRR